MFKSKKTPTPIKTNFTPIEKVGPEPEPRPWNANEGPKPRWWDYHEDGIDCYWRPITWVVSCTNKSCVYYARNETFFDYDTDKCKEVEETQEEYVSLTARVDTLAKKDKQNAWNLLAVSLSKALEKRVDGDKEDYFKEARRYIDTKINEPSEMRYLLGAFTATIFLALIFSVRTFYGSDFMPLLGGAFGAIGSLLSVLGRLRNTEFETYSSNIFAGFAGVIRILLGFISGIAFVILQRSGIILGGQIAANQDLLYAFAVISGFSERFVPDILARETKKEEDKENAEKGTGAKATA
jgi:hypothetical protein